MSIVKRICFLGLLCTVFGLSLLPARASSTNFWVLNMNFALRARVQVGNSVSNATISTKQVINWISGLTNIYNQIGTITSVARGSLIVSNSQYLQTNDMGSYTYTTDFVWPFLGTQVSFTEVTNNPLTYTFNNQVQVRSWTAPLFPDLPTTQVTAVQSSNNPGIFTLSGIVTNFTPIYAVMPDFSKEKDARLCYVIPIVDVTNYLTPRFEVRQSHGRTVTRVDVSDLFSENLSASVGSRPERAPKPGDSMTFYGDTGISFHATFDASQSGTTFSVFGLETGQYGNIASKGSLAAIGVPKQRRIVCAGDGTLMGQPQIFNSNTCVLDGSITFSGGHLEAGEN